MNILLNDKSLQIFSSSLLELLNKRTTRKQSYAVAVNDEFVPRSEYQTIVLNEGDRVELLIPMQGG